MSLAKKVNGKLIKKKYFNFKNPVCFIFTKIYIYRNPMHQPMEIC
jgi:hypothetical protein